MIGRPEPPEVYPGEPITVEIMEAQSAACRACRIIAGPGVGINEMPEGTIISFDGGALGFIGAFFVSLAGNAFAIQPGSINRVPAGIKGTPLGGKVASGSGLATGSLSASSATAGTKPLLTFAKLVLDQDQRGYVCAEVTCDPVKDWAVTKVEMVQVADPDTDDGKPGKTINASGAALPLKGNRARWPVAMIRQQSDGRIDVHQIVYFDLTHRVSLAADGKAAARHFFS